MTLDQLLTPALLISPSAVDANIDVTLRMLGGDPNRWRPHIKTAKLLSTMKQMTARGVRQFKCATTLELATACEARASDVLVAYPCWGPRALRVKQIALQNPSVAVSVLVEDAGQLPAFVGSRVGIFVDVNPGGDRTGIGQERTRDIVALAKAVVSNGLGFRGIHYYDGHHKQANMEERTAAAHQGYRQLIALTGAMRSAGVAVGEVVTSGTPSMPCAISFESFREAPFVHRVSAGTVVYNDLSSLEQLPGFGYTLAALVLTTVVSKPRPGLVTVSYTHLTLPTNREV